MSHILLIDDDEESRQQVSAILTKRDMKVTQLGSGAELLNYVEGMVPLPDLVILNWDYICVVR